ncbi:MAG: hypothetical protein ACLVD4_05760 [Negativibacillus sp.]
MMLERICFSVLESSLVASVLYALMMLGEGRLAKYSPRCRSTLWFILSARLLVPLPVGIVYFGGTALHRQNGSCWAGCGWREWQRFLPFICWHTIV